MNKLLMLKYMRKYCGVFCHFVVVILCLCFLQSKATIHFLLFSFLFVSLSLLTFFIYVTNMIFLLYCYLC